MPDIKIADGFNGYLATPAAAREVPGILVIQEIFGVNKFIREMCDRFAAMGYLALAPDLFWRLQPGVQLDPAQQFDEAIGLMNRFDQAEGIADLKTALEILRGNPDCSGQIGTVGYCLGGRLAFMMALESDAAANVGYYGVGLEGLVGQAGKIKAPLMLHIAEQDKYTPPEVREKVAAGLAGVPQATIHTYPGADHAFARTGGMHYDAAAAQLADARTAELFAKTLRL
jgi:carboxymethylenebutenolidase